MQQKETGRLAKSNRPVSSCRKSSPGSFSVFCSPHESCLPAASPLQLRYFRLSAAGISAGAVPAFSEGSRRNRSCTADARDNLCTDLPGLDRISSLEFHVHPQLRLARGAGVLPPCSFSFRQASSHHPSPVVSRSVPWHHRPADGSLQSLHRLQLSFHHDPAEGYAARAALFPYGSLLEDRLCASCPCGNSPRVSDTRDLAAPVPHCRFRWTRIIGIPCHPTGNNNRFPPYMRSK